MKKTSVFLFTIVAFLAISFGFIAPDEWTVPDKYKNMENPYAGEGDDDEIGLDLYEMHCASCHGDEGYGDGKKSGELDTPMRDFTSDAVQEQTDGELWYKSFIGRGEMPNFEKRIKAEEDQWLLINYIRILAE